MRIILLGAPGTGKGTQGKLIAKKYQIPQISTGDILRDNIASKSIIGEKIKDTVMKGKLISDKIICSLIHKRTQKKDCIHGFLLDGFPRNIKQAYYIAEKRIKIDYVLYLSMPDSLIFERISGRRVHMPSGRVYHVIFNPPQEKNKDDVTGEPLEIRSDDKKEIIENRLAEYKILTYPLKKYFQQEHERDNVKYIEIDAKKDVLEIQKYISGIIK